MSLLLDTAVSYILQIVPFVFLVGLVYLSVKYIRVKKRKTEWKSIWNEGLKFLMVCYFAGLIALVWVPHSLWNALWYQIVYGYYDPGAGPGAMFTSDFNLVPSIYRILRGELTGGEWIQTMTIGNILMFVPLGFILPLLKRKKKITEILKIALLIVLVIEIVQPFVGRSFDVDDVLYNMAGVLIGYVIYKFVDFIFPNLQKRCSK